MRKLHSKKGFTLIELTIVIAVLAIIVSMATAFIVSFSRANSNLQDNKTVMNDLAEIRSSIKKWIFCYDNAETTITTDGTTLISSSSASGTNEWKVFGDNIVSQLNGKETVTKLTGGSACSFEIKDNLLFCTVKYGTSEQKLAFALFTNSKRSRFSSADRE